MLLRLIHTLSFPPLHLQTIKNPNKTLLNSLSSPLTTTATMSSSWSCSSCTFLNPPSQKSTCQICETPISTSSSPPPKWSCKACTFLNSYSLSKCEICNNTRVSSKFDDDPDDDLGGSSNVGSVFFPLRRCNSTQIQDSDEFCDLGFKGKGEKCDLFVGKGVKLGGSQNSGSKSKFEDPVSDDLNSITCFDTSKKAENVGAGKSLVSEKDAENADGSIRFKRKAQDLDCSVEEPIQVNGFRGVKPSKMTLSISDKGLASPELAESAEVKKTSGEIKILSYNVWFREDLEVYKRMQAIGNLIELHSPDVICLQEVTANIYDILRNSKWWKKYRCSASYERAASEAYFCMQLAKLPVNSFSCRPFSYTAMGRELSIAELQPTRPHNPLTIATTHLESPCPGPPTWDQMFSKERVNQAKEAITFLQQHPNVIFCGDMNWDDKLDGKFPFIIEEGWFDAWEKLRPNEIGWTYDTKSNKMLTGNRTLQKRLDRFICRLPDFEVKEIEMIGTHAISGLTYTKQKKMKNRIQELTLPVLPSDHYGLLLTITSKGSR